MKKLQEKFYNTLLEESNLTGDDCKKFSKILADMTTESVKGIIHTVSMDWRPVDSFEGEIRYKFCPEGEEYSQAKHRTGEELIEMYE